MKIDEGYIKFNCIQENSTFDFDDILFNKLNSWREKLYLLNLIGCSANGIGFGNLSVRHFNGQLIITGTATGAKKTLSKDDYALVKDYDLEKNHVICNGKTKASAETMSHAAIYESNPGINAVIHIHHLKLWKKLKDNLPTTRYDIEYGTPQMAFEIMRLFKESKVMETKIFVMGGHQEGIITFGKDLDEAGQIITGYFMQAGKYQNR